MLSALLIWALVAVGVLVLMWTGTLLAQGYFYDSPVPGLPWRAAASAGAVAGFLLLWVFIEYAAPGKTDGLFNFTHEDSREVEKFWSVRKSSSGEEEIEYKRRKTSAGRSEYIDREGKPWRRSGSGAMVAIVVEEKEGEKVRLDAEMDEQGRFAPRKTGDIEQSLRYLGPGGRVMTEDQLGKVVVYRSGRLVWNILLNVLHLVVWFVVLWLLLRFNWTHALGFAFVCWLVFTLALVPLLLTRARDAGMKPTTAPKPTATLSSPRAPDFAAAPARNRPALLESQRLPHDANVGPIQPQGRD